MFETAPTDETIRAPGDYCDDCGENVASDGACYCDEDEQIERD